MGMKLGLKLTAPFLVLIKEKNNVIHNSFLCPTLEGI